jgi:hypothetical protein
MSIWSFVKLLAALAVLAVMGFTGMLAYHVVVVPLDGVFGGIFEKIIPNPAEVVRGQSEADFVRMLDSVEMPDVEPGEKAFQKAHELIALGRLDEAREKLNAIVNIFPTSSSAPVARRIVGEMNLDEILSSSHMAGKQTHVVKRGDSFFAMVAKHRTTLELLMHLNGLTEFGNLRPGDEFIVMPLDFRLLIVPSRKSLSVWDGGRFIREYPVVEVNVPGTIPAQRTKIDSKSATVAGRGRVQALAKEYAAAEKSIQLAGMPLQIRQYNEDDEDRPRGIYLRPLDMEELNLLTRSGNEVEIR